MFVISQSRTFGFRIFQNSRSFSLATPLPVVQLYKMADCCTCRDHSTLSSSKIAKSKKPAQEEQALPSNLFVPPLPVADGPNKRVVICGGYLSGLACAYELDAAIAAGHTNLDVTLLDRGGKKLVTGSG